MPTLINLVRSYARKLLTSRGTGITQIPNRQQVDVLANNILSDFKRHKISSNVLKTEQDVKNMHNYIDSLDEQKLEKTFEKFFSPSGKMKPEGEDIVKKGLEGLGKKPPFQGFTPTIVKDKTLLRDSPEAIAKIKADNKAAAERLRNKKKTVEDFRDDGDFDPGGMASGGLARVGMFTGGTIGKGAMWFIKNLRQAYDELVAGKAFTNLDPMKKELLRFEILAQIKNIEKGGPIPQDMINAMRRDPRFKDIMKTRSTDPELYEVEEIMLGKSSGKSDADRMKDFEQKIQLEDFDPKDRLPNAKGGVAGQLHLNEGGRVPMIFGGSAGLRALIKRMKGKNKRIFPGKIGVDKRELAKTLMPRELEQLQNLKISQLENLLESLKLDKQQMALRAQNKALNDPGLDFMMKKFDEMPESGLTSEADLAKYVDIDKDILTLEQMIKNKTMKDRKPNAYGGLAHILGV